MIRDLLGFQLKLVLDGLKDIALGPLALAAGIAGLFARSGHPGRYLYRVLRLGRRYEGWIDLYGAADDSADMPRARDAERESIDGYMERLAAALSAQSRRGGLTGRAREAVDRALDALEDGTRRGS